jgi:hypothetical protein
MIASKLDKLDLSGNQPVITDPSWEDCVDGFKQADIDMGSAFHRKLDWMNKAADIYLQDNNKMAGFVGKFAEDCDISYRYGINLNRIRNVPHEGQNFSRNAWEALLSAPEELREEIVSSDKPVTVSEVKEAKKGYKAVLEDESNADLKEKVESKEIKPVEAAKIANDRFEKKKKEMEERDNTFDLVEHISSTENYEVGVVATNFAASMEQLISKFDGDQVTDQIYLALKEDVINIKIPALHKMSDILLELCERLPLTNIKTLN